ncbi:MAG: 5-formyltetrahydrofolate cyclo-ligase [Clostridia bacterium]|nr:5-formyltetrahydrofolate cyclo-ligase [Clostridia bacterium]
MKEKQRAFMRKVRDKMSEDEVVQKSRKIREILFCTSFYKNADTIMTYLSAKNEPDTLEIVKVATQSGKKIVVPIADMKTNNMRLSYLPTLDGLCRNSFGILEPRGDFFVPCDVQNVDLILVPGLAFDEKGGRIGYGKGFYDRFLTKTKAVFVALCYDFQVIEKVAAEAHDVFMDFILTESRLIDCGKK